MQEGSLSYAWEKLYDAVRILAMGKADIRERLYSAHLSGIERLSRLPIPDENLDEKLKEIANEFRAKDTVRASLDAMSDEHASEMAGKIVDLFDAVLVEYTKERL